MSVAQILTVCVCVCVSLIVKQSVLMYLSPGYWASETNVSRLPLSQREETLWDQRS